MTELSQQTMRVVLYEGRGSSPLAPAMRSEILAVLLDAGYAVTCAAADGPVAPADDAPTMVIGRFGGTVPEVRDAVSTADIEGLAAAEVLAAVTDSREQLQAPVPGEWVPWFPVIDYDRCTNCMQCLSFCLFGVYGVSGESKIQVQNNEKCKTNCPACSRVCPEAAIMFPKYKAGPVNGAEITEAGVEREQLKVDISALLGGDIYSALKNRSERARERFAKERDEKVALQERRKCLVDLQKDLDIPPEVLMSLPSQQEILQRAEVAREAADVARQQAAESVERRLRDRHGDASA